jgi:magnesium transporter
MSSGGLGGTGGSAPNLLALRTTTWADDVKGGLGGGGAAGVPSAASLPSLTTSPPLDPSAALRVLGKSGAVRTWLRIDASGDMTWLQLDKHGIAQRCGVPLRDLRVLEPGLTTSFSTTLLCRERTMVINLEAVKMLVSHQEALIPNADLPEVSSFAGSLARRLKGEHLGRVFSAPNLGAAAAGGQGDKTPQHGVGGVQPGVGGGGGGHPGSGQPPHSSGQLGDSGEGSGDRDLPFEFRVLEAALEAVCGTLELAAQELESEAHPALDALTSKVTSFNLERVKRVKGRMTRATGRIAAVREEIQRFLDDDSDMRDMYLTRKAAAAEAMAFNDGGMGGRDGYGRPSSEGAPRTGGPGGMGDGQGTPFASQQQQAQMLYAMDDDADIQQLEDLLETYFAQIDHAYNRMKALDEFVASTEDYINIDLDSHRNQLIQIDLLLSFSMFISSLFTLVTGIFGMNLDSGLQTDPKAFDEVVIISSVLVVAGIVLFVVICRRVRLITIF